MCYLAKTYTARCRFYADSSTEHHIQWYWAEPGAALFPHYNLFGPSVYRDRNMLPSEIKYPGEIPDTRVYNDGSNPHNALGQAGCQIGLTEWFAKGVPAGTPDLDISTVPLCCGVWEREPYLDGSQYLAGYPDINMPALTYPGLPAVFAIVWVGDITTPPTPPDGWTILVNGPLGDEGWMMVGWMITPDPRPDFVVEGGSLSQASGTLFPVWAADLGVTDSALSEDTNTIYSVAPSLNSPSAVAMLIAIYFEDDGIVPTGWPAGMAEFSGGGLDRAACQVFWQGGVGAGPTGTRTAQFGTIPVDQVYALSLLVR